MDYDYMLVDSRTSTEVRFVPTGGAVGLVFEDGFNREIIACASAVEAQAALEGGADVEVLLEEALAALVYRAFQCPGFECFSDSHGFWWISSSEEEGGVAFGPSGIARPFLVRGEHYHPALAEERGVVLAWVKVAESNGWDFWGPARIGKGG